MPASVLSLAHDQINQVTAFPLSGTAINPDIVGVSLNTTIKLTAGASSTDKQTASAQAVAAATDYINNLGVSKPLVINEIAAAIRNSSSKILDVGDPDHEVNEIYIWRGSWCSFLHP